MRIVTLVTAGFALAAAAFVATMLVSPPTSAATRESSPSRIDTITICVSPPSGDVARCPMIQN